MYLASKSCSIGTALHCHSLLFIDQEVKEVDNKETQCVCHLLAVPVRSISETLPISPRGLHSSLVLFWPQKGCCVHIQLNHYLTASVICGPRGKRGVHPSNTLDSDESCLFTLLRISMVEWLRQWWCAPRRQQWTQRRLQLQQMYIGWIYILCCRSWKMSLRYTAIWFAFVVCFLIHVPVWIVVPRR